MIAYTKEEYRILYDLFEDKTKRIAQGILQAAEGKVPIMLETWYGTTYEYLTIEKAIESEFRYHYKMMYELPFDELPLHINDQGIIDGAVIKWRLLIGK